VGNQRCAPPSPGTRRAEAPGSDPPIATKTLPCISPSADGILDRLVHHAHRIEMRADSMRKKRGTQPSS
jgi:hypothetical protein